jgi:hypothetical protein
VNDALQHRRFPFYTVCLGTTKVATLQTKVGLLNSWKEIASYLGRGVRTAQRWEKYGLPVRRLAPGPRASVIADAREIDKWIQSAKAHGFPAEEPSAPALVPAVALAPVRQFKPLRDEHDVLENGKNRLAQLLANVARLRENCERASQLARSIKSSCKSSVPN